jgi:hypothetical protein
MRRNKVHTIAAIVLNIVHTIPTNKNYNNTKMIKP